MDCLAIVVLLTVPDGQSCVVISTLLRGVLQLSMEAKGEEYCCLRFTLYRYPFRCLALL
jgi:hypothetical protein